MKKVLMIFLSIALVFTMAAPAFAADTVADKFAELKEAGILDGGTGGVLPDSSYVIQRQHLAKIAAKLAGLDAEVGAVIEEFAGDNKTGVWGFEQGWIQAAYNAEPQLMKGEGGTFNATKQVTMAHLLTVVLRAAGFGDELDNDNWKASAVEVALANGFIASSVNPDAIATYGDLVNQTYNAYEELNAGDLKVLSVKAVNSETVKVQLNKDAELNGTDFSIVQKNNQNVVAFVEDVKVKNKEATLTLINQLGDKKTYLLTVEGATGTFEFTYNKGTPTSIEFVDTTVLNGKTVEYVIYDQNGNDMTVDAGDIDVYTSNSAVIDTNLDALIVGTAIVNLSYEVEEDVVIETGNTLIKVVDSTAKLTSLGEWTLAKEDEENFKKPKHDMFVSDEDLILYVEVLDQDGEEFAGATESFRSLNPTIAVIDEVEGTITALQAGSAKFVYTAKHGAGPNEVVLSKTVTVTVKADPKATTFVITTSGSDLVDGSDIDKPISIKILDQYGKDFAVTGGAGPATNVHVKASKAGVVEIAGGALDGNEIGTGYVQLNGYVNAGVVDFAVYPVGLGTKQSDSVTLTFRYGPDAPISPLTTLNIKVVSKGDHDGYAAELENSVLDLYQDDEDLTQGPKTTLVKVYKTDNKGNYIEEIVAAADPDTPGEEEFVLKLATASKGVAIDADNETINSTAKGTGKVEVYVEGVKITTLTVNVVNSEPVLTTASQVKSSITVEVNGDIKEALFGVLDDVPPTAVKLIAFAGYDQYGERIAIDATTIGGDNDDVKAVASSNAAIVEVDGNNINAVAEGTAVLTIKIGTKFFTINVKVVPEP